MGGLDTGWCTDGNFIYLGNILSISCMSNVLSSENQR